MIFLPSEVISLQKLEFLIFRYGIVHLSGLFRVITVLLTRCFIDHYCIKTMLLTHFNEHKTMYSQILMARTPSVP